MAVVPAAEQALAVLRYLGTQAQPAAAAAISRELCLPRSTTYHLLDTLVRAGFVVHVAEERRYALGVAVYELASGYARQTSLQRLARAPLATLVDNTGQNAHLAIMHGRDVIYVIEERATGRPPLITDVGVRLPAHLTASGRAMLAQLPRAQVRALYAEPGSFVLRNDRGPRSLAALRQLLAETRGRGFASEDGEVTPEFASVAVAASDRAGYPAAAVAVTFPSAEVDATGTGAPRRTARARTAAEVSRRLGPRTVRPESVIPDSDGRGGGHRQRSASHYGSMNEIAVGVEALTEEQVIAVARHDAQVRLSDEARKAIVASREIIEALADDPEPHYGISTGFGALATKQIAQEDRVALQRSLIRSHAAGSGPEVEREVVRALMLLRLSTLATGRTGVRLQTAETYAAMLNAGITPVVHEFGSLGCSGDLAPLAHCALAAMGEGTVRVKRGATTEGGSAAKRSPRPTRSPRPESRRSCCARRRAWRSPTAPTACSAC